MICPASCTLPYITSEAGSAAKRGTEIHAFIENCGKLGREAALSAVTNDDLRAICEAIDVTVIPAGAEHEVAMGLDVATGRAYRYALDSHRGYPEDGFLHGTTDLVWVLDGCVVVLDFKTGKWVVLARESWQLKALAIMAAKLAGLDEARVALAYLQDDGSWKLSWDSLDAFELSDAEARIASLKTRALRGEYSTGEHCRFCPSLTLCPAQTQMAKAIVPSLAEVEDKLASLTPKQQGEVWERVRLAEELIGKVKTAIGTMAAASPIPLPNGKTLKQIVVNRQSLADGFGPTLAAAVGADAIVAKLAGSISWIEDSFGAETLATLARAGYVGTTVTKQIRAVGGKRK